jgi:cAMP-dependent protein kinase regulator
MLLDDAPAAPAAPAQKRHPMLLDDAPAAAPATGPKRHPMVLDDAPAAAPAAGPTRHPMVLDDGPAAAAPKQYPTLADAPPPSAAKQRAPVAPPPNAPRTVRRRPVTLDKISLPPPVQSLRKAGALPPAPRVPEVADAYGQALGGVMELSIDTSGPANETRFSNAPPRPGLEVALSDDELAPREQVSELESQRPAPPTAAKLSKLPLFPLFAEVPKEALAEMIAGTELIELAHGDYVMRKGDPGDAMYGIVEGSVGIVVPGQILNLTLAEGDVFGESCLLQDEKRHADVIVQGKLVALRVPRDVLTTLFGRHPKLAEVLLELLTRRLLGNLLQTSPLFQEFDAAGRRELSRLFEIRRAPAKTMLAVVGKKMDGLYISLTGELEVQQPGAPKRVAPPGSMFGQNTLLSNEPSQVDIKTRVNMIVLRLPASAFSRVAMQYPAILARLAELSASEVVKVST